MLNYLLSILGLAALTALWMVFQLWLKRHDPEQDGRCIGCGANCKSRDRGTENRRAMRWSPPSF
jgi:hypothetical protein